MNIFLGIWLTAALLFSGPAIGQEAGAVESVQLAAIDAAPVPESIKLSANKARVYKLPRDARDVLVSNPGIADVVIKTPRLVYVVGREVGDTNVFFFDGDGNQILRLEVRVDLDVSALNDALSQLMPNERITAAAVNKNIVLRGTVRSAKAAEGARLIARRFVKDDTEIVNMIGISSEQQVMLRVRVSEMQRTIVKELGFNTQFRKMGDNDINLNFGTGVSPDAFGTALFATSAFDVLTTMIDALESQGLVKVLAEPNLTAVSGENANFLVGGEFPIPVPQDKDQITIEFRQFGVLLTFTPVVLTSGAISLKISTEVSQLSTQGQVTLANFVIPALTVRRAETTVEMPSGGSMIIAGLLQNDIRNTVDGFPGLKDIPVLGALFRSVAFRKDETELVVAVTPYLVQPVSEKIVTLPTDGFAPASDFDLYLLGRLHDVYRREEETTAMGRVQGPIGYIME